MKKFARFRSAFLFFCLLCLTRPALAEDPKSITPFPANGVTLESQLVEREPAQLEDWKRKALALSGIFAAVIGLNQETLELAKMDQTSIESWKKVLAEEWGVANRKQLLEKFAFLEAKGDSEVFREFLRLLEKNPDLTINQMVKELEYKPEIINRLYFVKEKKGLIGDRTLRAWDFSRMALLCRIGYQVGFISSSEAWAYLERILMKVEDLYLSWEDYASNYILGVIFQAAELGLEIEAGNQGLRAYAELINRPGTAWQISWGRKVTVNQAGGNTMDDVLYSPSPQLQAWKDYLNGRQCYQRGELSDALNYFENGLTLDRQFADLWLMAAIVYNRLNDFEKAVEAFEEYLVKEPGDYLTRIYLAEVYEKNDQLQEAIAEYNRAIDLDDSRAEGFVGLGRIAINSGDYQLAVNYLLIAQNLAAGEEQGIYYTLYLMGYSYYKAEKFDQALSYFLRAYNGYQDNMYLHYYLGICYLYNQNSKLASTYFERAVALGLKIPPEVKGLLNGSQIP